MWWRERREIIRAMARLGAVLAVAGLVAGCFEPLYGRNPSLGDESIRDKLAEVLIAPIPSRQGTPGARIAVITHNAAIADMGDRVISFRDGRIADTRTNATRKSASELSW